MKNVGNPAQTATSLTIVYRGGRDNTTANSKGEKINMTVVRNAAYSRGGFNVRERHNERKNECYGNGDIDLGRADLNVPFCRPRNLDGEPFTYEQIFNAMLAGGEISTHGLKPDAHVFDEMIFDVNTEYFEERGGHEYAKRFYEEAYRLAVKEVGGEQFILSAVLHADERNKEVSQRLGRDVYHYHLHVVYVPVVRKELYFKKNNKNPELAGKLKEVITQVSHSKKWPMKTPVEKNGKTYLVNAYSLLQDRFFEHMRAAGFEGFERGERGSTKEHLDTLDYKIQQDKKQLAALDGQVEQTAAQIAAADEALKKKKAQSKQLDEKIAVKKTQAATLAGIDAIGKPIPIVGGYSVTPDEMKKLKSWARQVFKAQEQMAKMTRDMDALKVEFSAVKRERDDAKRESGHWYREFKSLETEVKPFIDAIRKFPQKMLELVKSLFPPVKQQEQAQEIQPHRKKSHDIGGR